MTKRIKLRTLLVGGLITLFFVVLVGKIYWVQVVKADYWTEKARVVWSKSETLVPVRGTISDREGNVLAMDTAAYTVAVNPKVIHELGIENFVVSKLHTILGKSESELREIVTAKKDDGTFFTQREVRKEGWKIDKSVRDRIINFREELKEQTKKTDVGIYLIDQQKRYYPKNKLAAHLIGYVDKDGKAITGLEAYYDNELKGVEGKIQYKRDGNGIILENEKVEFKPSRDGKNVKLTIDADIQHYVEEAIQEAYDKYQPKSITAIAADPQTMEILGMANMPTFNPNEFGKAPQINFYNHITKSSYEPGSTFKIVTLAGAVEEGVFNPNEEYMSGKIKVGKSWLRDVKREGWGSISFLEGLKRSSNVAFVKMGYERLKADKLIQYIKDFGFGQKTGIELPGEINGVMNINPNRAVEVATASFGQGPVSVTPIQQITAVAAVANGGKLMQPHIIKEIEDPVTNKTEVVQPKMVRQVISEETSKQVSEYLEQVVSDQKIGTGKNAYIPGYRVAGKTGTAQKVTDGKGYSDEKYVVSFIGFAPVGNPKIIVYVVVDEPNDRYAGGGSVAAPVFKKIVEQSLRKMNVMPVLPANSGSKSTTKQKEMTVTVPDLSGLGLSQAKAELKSRSLVAEIVGSGTAVKQQIPKLGTETSLNQKVYLITEDRDKLPIPNMRGLPLRDALEICTLLNIRCVTEGQGFVTAQVAAMQNGERVLKLVLTPPGPDTNAESGDGSDAGNKAEEGKSE
ncbi:penicillin-binding transpeptidase domain-containing protein [Paenibacillus mendelii]|uniref:Penicillin-binding transpeptidase domain-containing protein n=1 Tax=Paenibacillus mendelii TaxID=206163 RepID=A0ABV6JIR9_9BACL|nr:penicillin-binding transpeptidase domain-containing protein [Paenibacillus mendelii]MCQ6558271.1 penicillin-binding transpeptidase domain-containing protein [Paenibacillus mendelii]